MSRPRNTEPQANGALARALRRRNPDWNDKTVHAERTNVIQLAVPGTGAGKRPDILIAPPRRQPVILETEFAPAHTVDQDATARLGTSLHSTGEEIEGVLSVVLPESLKTGDFETVDRAAFRYATHYLDSKGDSIRWPPEREWLEGGVDDLADAIEYLSLSERRLARGTEALEQVVRSAAELLAEHAGEMPRRSGLAECDSAGFRARNPITVVGKLYTWLASVLVDGLTPAVWAGDPHDFRTA